MRGLVVPSKVFVVLVSLLWTLWTLHRLRSMNMRGKIIIRDASSGRLGGGHGTKIGHAHAASNVHSAFKAADHRTCTNLSMSKISSLHGEGEIKHNHLNGVLYITATKRSDNPPFFRNQLWVSISSVQRHQPDIPIHVFTDDAQWLSTKLAEEKPPHLLKLFTIQPITDRRTTQLASKLLAPIKQRIPSIYNVLFYKLAKMHFMQQTPFRHTLFMDLDTVVCTSIAPIFQYLEKFDFFATSAFAVRNGERQPGFNDLNSGVMGMNSDSHIFDAVIRKWEGHYLRSLHAAALRADETTDSALAIKMLSMFVRDQVSLGELLADTIGSQTGSLQHGLLGHDIPSVPRFCLLDAAWNMRVLDDCHSSPCHILHVGRPKRFSKTMAVSALECVRPYSFPTAETLAGPGPGLFDSIKMDIDPPPKKKQQQMVDISKNRTKKKNERRRQKGRKKGGPSVKREKLGKKRV